MPLTSRSVRDNSHWLKLAIRLGRSGLGTCWPNPSVGAILVKDGRLLARGRTQPPGGPHAEIVALQQAGADARGATLYVSLEPCAHHGRTPPCTDAISAAGIQRVVAPIADPNPEIRGRGFEVLRAAGVDVDVGEEQALARDAHAGFAQRINKGRPHITLKLAVSADNAIGESSEGNVPITVARSRRHVQALRTRFDAILVGAGTVRADNPRLTCRLPGLEGRSPVRVAIFGADPVEPDRNLFQDQEKYPTWAIVPANRENRFPGQVKVFAAKAEDGRTGLQSAVEVLADQGLNRILVEGGARLARSFIEADLVDEVHLFRSPITVGEGGVAALAGLSLAAIENGPRFRRMDVRRFDQDLMSRFQRHA